MLFRIKLLDFCTFNIKPYNVRMNEFMNVSECILVHSWLERVLRVHRNDIQRQNSQILAPDGVSINNGSNQFVKFIVITRQGPLKCYVTQGGVSVFPEKSITEVYDSSTSLALRGGGGGQIPGKKRYVSLLSAWTHCCTLWFSVQLSVNFIKTAEMWYEIKLYYSFHFKLRSKRR